MREYFKRRGYIGRLEGGEKDSANGSRRVKGRGEGKTLHQNSQCKGPEAGVCVQCSKNSKEAGGLGLSLYVGRGGRRGKPGGN